MRKKKSKIVLLIFIVLLLVAVAFLSLYGESIKSILLGLRVSETEIKKLRNENQTKLVENVNEFMEMPLREMTEQEKLKVESGEATASEIYQQLFEEKINEKSGEGSAQTNPDTKPQTGTQAPSTQGDKPQSGNSTENTAGSSTTKDLLVSEAMVKLYSLQNEFNARAEATIKEGANYYLSLRKHPQDAEARAQTISQFTPTVRGIEGECDAKVEKVIVQLEKDLKSMGADTSICTTIRATYENEKQLKLSYYTNKYLK